MERDVPARPPAAIRGPAANDTQPRVGIADAGNGGDDGKLSGPVVVPDFVTLFRTYSGFVLRVLLRLGVAQADVDDVAQEVFLGVHRNIERFEGRCSVRTWIYGICHRRAVDYRRRARVRPALSSEGEVDVPEPAGQERTVMLSEARVSLERLLASLDDDKRTVFVLFEIEGIPMDEVAEIVNCPLQTAYSRLYAARKKVEGALKRERVQRGDAP